MGFIRGGVDLWGDNSKFYSGCVEIFSEVGYFNLKVRKVFL